MNATNQPLLYTNAEQRVLCEAHTPDNYDGAWSQIRAEYAAGQACEMCGDIPAARTCTDCGRRWDEHDWQGGCPS